MTQSPPPTCTRRSCTYPSALSWRLAVMKEVAPIRARLAVSDRVSRACAGRESCQVRRRAAWESRRGCRMISCENWLKAREGAIKLR
ncbi:hypothetical protein DEJ45_13400 [Streptomyces venezuelae]|nr:hypothetical protein DEJ45_13400 [Streptomyces venezuelae]